MTNAQLRRTQVITTYGPGALIDLPKDSAVVGGLDSWPRPDKLVEVREARLSRKLQMITGVVWPRLYEPPVNRDPFATPIGIAAYRFPEWFVVQDERDDRAEEHARPYSRRLVHRRSLDDRDRFDGLVVVATRFVRSCSKGHVDDVDWYAFVHGPDATCRRQLWLDERGTSGDLADLHVRCECGKSRSVYEASERGTGALGPCRGRRPWLGPSSNEPCAAESRLLIRTASNAYFPQVVSVLSIPDRGKIVDDVVTELWEDMSIVESEDDLAILRRKPRVAQMLQQYSATEVLEAIAARKKGGASDRPVKEVELDALLGAPEGYGDDVPVNRDFHARRLPSHVWRRTNAGEAIESVVQLHRLREVLALIGFTRLEAVTPDINGEYESDVERAPLADDPRWFPAVENRGEGVFISLSRDRVREWLGREAVTKRLDVLKAGHDRWARRGKSKRSFPGGPYVLLHTLSHLLIQSLAIRCGYPASSIRERVYVEEGQGRYGILLYTGSPDADGTLGGLVQQARHIEEHLGLALRLASLCSNDPVCANHDTAAAMEGRWLHGAACHGCVLVAETSCEMRNDYLDRALVVPVMGQPDAAFFAGEW